MATNQNAYNTRLTDEALEKRFRDTFRAQGGAELVDDLYASGVIVPIVDFTAAAEGTSLSESLQQAWDFSNGRTAISGSASNIVVINNPGFWKVDITLAYNAATPNGDVSVLINDGSTSKYVWNWETSGGSTNIIEDIRWEGIVFLRSGDDLRVTQGTSNDTVLIYRQIADVSGNIVNPFGFTSS